MGYAAKRYEMGYEIGEKDQYQGVYSGMKSGIILHDYLATFGGAELLVHKMAETLHDFDICFGFIDRRTNQELQFNYSAVYSLRPPVRNANAVARTLMLSSAFKARTSFLKEYKTVIYSGTLAPLAAHNHPIGKNIYYCHTIPRFAYDLEQFYRSKLPFCLRPFLSLLALWQRKVYSEALRQMDVVLANSVNVQKRLKKYLDLDSVIVYPPCDTTSYKWLSEGGYYLSTARLEDYKRVDLIINAFLEMPDKELIVTSEGSKTESLQKMARNAKNIKFTGWLDKDKLVELVGRSIATIYLPIDEDFGISPVESMAAGKPVIGVQEGGLLETVVHNQTGILIPSSPSVEDLKNAIKDISPAKAIAMRGECERRAKLFSENIFESYFKSIKW